MASPFNTLEEFMKAEGAIYSFADKPVVNAVLLVLSAFIMVLFIVKAYTIKH